MVGCARQLDIDEPRRHRQRRLEVRHLGELRGARRDESGVELEKAGDLVDRGAHQLARGGAPRFERRIDVGPAAYRKGRFEGFASPRIDRLKFPGGRSGVFLSFVSIFIFRIRAKILPNFFQNCLRHRPAPSPWRGVCSQP